MNGLNLNSTSDTLPNENIIQGYTYLTNLETAQAIEIAYEMLENGESFIPAALYLINNTSVDFAECFILPLLDKITLPHDFMIRIIPSNYIYCWLKKDKTDCLNYLKHLIRSDFSSLCVDTWCNILMRLVDEGEIILAKEIVAKISANPKTLGIEIVKHLYTTFFSRSRLALREKSQPTFGVLGFNALLPSRCTKNIDDYIETLGFLSSVACVASVVFGENDFTIFMNEIKSILRKDVLHNDGIKFNIVEVSREFPSSRNYPSPTWLFVYGRSMGHLYEDSFDFPFADSIRPIFLSWHIADRAILTEESIRYLRKYQPIGCRDWGTVFILREYGIDAFMNGPVTSMMDNFDLLKLRSIAPVGSDLGVGAGEDRHVVDGGNLTTNLTKALFSLSKLASLQMVKTGSLQTYYASIAMGLDTEFDNPKKFIDPQFDGLIPVDPQDLNVSAAQMKDKIITIMQMVCNGYEEQEVYKFWRKINSNDVIKARKFCTLSVSIPKETFNVREISESIIRSKCSRNCHVQSDYNVSMTVDSNLANILPVLIYSIVTNSRKRIHFNILTRGLSEEYYTRVSKVFSQASFCFFSCDDVPFGNYTKAKHITVSAIDRILLPLLVDFEKTVYLDVDTLVLADIKDLYDTELEGKYLAAAPSYYRGWKYCHNLLNVGLKQPKYSDAFAIRHCASHLGRLDNQGFNSGVMVMNLQKMRQNAFSESMAPIICSWHCRDQPGINLFVRDDYKRLDPDWNVFIHQRYTEDPKIIHWVGSKKPWGADFVPWKRHWLEYQSRFEDYKSSLLEADPKRWL